MKKSNIISKVKELGFVEVSEDNWRHKSSNEFAEVWLDTPDGEINFSAWIGDPMLSDPEVSSTLSGSEADTTFAVWYKTCLCEFQSLLREHRQALYQLEIELTY